jgi:hypothetical protein
VTGAAAPYGPQTAAIRHYLVRLAGLSRSDRLQVVAAYASHQQSAAFQHAEDELAVVMERSGREDARAALSGPLLQLVKRAPVTADSDRDVESTDALHDMDPVAEPALAALLALLVRDLLPDEAFRALTAPMALVLPFDER